MAVAYRSIANTTYAARTNTTVTKPTGTANADILVGWIVTALSGEAPDPTPPSGFSLVSEGTFPIDNATGGFNLELRVYSKPAGESEPANYTFTHSNCSSQGGLVAISGAGAEPTIRCTTNKGSETTTTFLGLTTKVAESLILLIAHDWADKSNNLTAPTGSTPTFTERLDTTLSYVASGVLAAAGATGNKTMTNNNNASGSSLWGTVMVAIEPKAASAATSLVSRPRRPGRVHLINR